MPRRKWSEEERRAWSEHMKSVWADPELRTMRTAANRCGARERTDRLRKLNDEARCQWEIIFQEGKPC